jgi:hypothetical protein
VNFCALLVTVLPGRLVAAGGRFACLVAEVWVAEVWVAEVWVAEVWVAEVWVAEVWVAEVWVVEVLVVEVLVVEVLVVEVAAAFFWLDCGVTLCRASTLDPFGPCGVTCRAVMLGRDVVVWRVVVCDAVKLRDVMCGAVLRGAVAVCGVGAEKRGAETCGDMRGAAAKPPPPPPPPP